MSKFLVLDNSPVPAEQMMTQVTPEQAQAGMAQWNEWAEKNSDSIIDLGAPLGSGKHVGTIDVLEFLEMPGMEA